MIMEDAKIVRKQVIVQRYFMINGLIYWFTFVKVETIFTLLLDLIYYTQ